MKRRVKVSDLARLAAVTATPHSEPLPEDRVVRYTAEVPRHLHRHLKTFALEHDATSYAVTRALLTLLQSDPEVVAKVDALLRGRDDARPR